MATRIVLNRKREMQYRARGFKVIIDGEELGKMITSGSSEEYELTPGMHTIQCKINWCTSPELTLRVNEGETKFLKVKSALKYYLPLYVIALLAIVGGLLLTKTQLPDHFYQYQLILLLPFLLYNIYYVSIGRNKYLVLEEDKENIFS